MSKKSLLFIGLALITLTSCTQMPNVNPQLPDNTADTDSTTMSNPQDIVEDFMLATLGTLPNANVDYDKARTMMSSSYVTEFTDPMFIPQAYGMQDGPTGFEFESQDVMDDTAEVVVMGYWGDDLQMRWKFELVKEAGNWKVNFINPGQ